MSGINNGTPVSYRISTASQRAIGRSRLDHIRSDQQPSSPEAHHSLPFKAWLYSLLMTTTFFYFILFFLLTTFMSSCYGVSLGWETFLIIPRDTLLFALRLSGGRFGKERKGTASFYVLSICMYSRGLSTRRDYGLVPGKRNTDWTVFYLFLIIYLFLLYQIRSDQIMISVLSSVSTNIVCALHGYSSCSWLF